MEKEELKSNIKTPSTWSRGFFMLLFLIFVGIAKGVATFITFAQFFFALFTAKPNENLRIFSASLVKYIADAWLFLTYNSETKPFPFESWPK